MSDMISKNHFQTKHCHCNSNGSSIWDRLPYNIGMEFHQCTNHTETQNDDEWLSSFYCHQQQLQKQQQQQQPPPTTFLSTSSTLSTLSRLSSLEIFSHLNEDFNQKINKIEKTSSTMNENDENIQNDYDNRINPVYNRIVKRNNNNFNFNLNKKTTYAGDDHYDDDDDGDGSNGDGDLNETTTSAECSSIRLKYELVSSIVANISTTSIITASNIPATTTTATTSTTTAAAAATRTTQTRNDLKDKSAPARTIHKNSKFFNNFYCKFRNDKLFVAILYLIVYILSSSKCLAARQDVATNCTFPARWEGSWFLSGYQQSIHIKGSQFSYRGKCAASDGNKFLIVDERGCHRCLVIYEKHKNVLQYKESECDGDSMYMDQSNPAAMPMRSILKSDHRGGAHPNLNGHSRLSLSDQYIMRSNDDMTDDYHCKGRETLQNLCDQIPGDALLYSLFRENAEPVKCPLKGPFVFTYNRGHGECKSPVSNIESCTEESRLLLSFQACPDVLGTESTVEELTCLATWKDGNSRYLVGLVSHHHALSNEERYRCFVYDKLSSLMGGLSSSNLKDAEYKLAQSGDATCNGLDSAEVGSRIMTLRKPPPAERCDFPVWFKGPRHWHALMGNAVYNYHPNDGSMHIIKSNGYMETRALCEQINKQTSTEMMAVVHYTTGCKSGFMCMIFYRRDTHVIEIQSGIPASRLEDACAPDYFDINKMPYITLLANNPDPQICPLEGLYNLRGAIGPPYITSRHKRNHNNKGHNQHGHHHHELGHKRHGTLNFRNSEEQQLGSSGSAWHTKSPSELAIRNRRASHVIIPPASVPLSSSSLSSSSTSSSSPHELETTISNSKNDSSTNGNGHQDTIDGSGRNIGNIGNSGHSTKSTSRQLNLDESQSAKITIIMDKENEKENHHHQNFHQQKQEQQQTSSSINAIVNSGSGSSNKIIDDVRRFNESQRNRRNAPGCIVNYNAQRQLWIGCTGPNLIDVRPQCDEEGNEEYSCHGSWSENGTTYVIARHKGTKHGVCISYRPLEGNAAKLVIGDACYRGILNPPEHHLVANLTVYGKCGDTSSSNTNPCTDWILMLLTTAIILSITIFTNR